MGELLNRVEQTIRTRRLFRPGQRILVAVSGGVDSLVLLHLLHDLAPKHKWRLKVAHFNHQLRGRSSAADEHLVRRAAARLKLPVVIHRADVRRFARTRKLSLEMAARKLRHDFLAAAAAQRGIPTIALAHHADDQLELFFLRLLRGSGGGGLGGMKWRSPSPSNPRIELVRPLLDQPKAMLRRHATQQGIRHHEDASNALLDFQRNRIRHELLPLLRKSYQPALDKVIPRVMEIVGAEAGFAAQAAREWLRGREASKGRGAESKEVGASLLRGLRPRESEQGKLPFDDLPAAVQRCCVQFQLLKQGIEPGYELVEHLRLSANIPVAAGPVVRRAKPMGTGERSVLSYAVRDGTGLVHLQVQQPERFKPGSVEVELRGRAGEVEFGGARIWWLVSSRRGGDQVKGMVGREYFDADKVGSPVSLRHWRPGDRFQPIGMACPVRLQDFFTNQKVPRAARRQCIVATTSTGEVFWVEGMRISERFKLTRQTIRRLQWRWKRL